MTRFSRHIMSAALLGVLLGIPAFASGPAAAQGQVQNPATAATDGDFCIPLSQIARTTVVDARTILVRMRGKDQDRRITLVNDCPGLRFSGFIHESSLDRLCRTDPLRVIEPQGFGATCAIRSITPITKAEADALEKNPG